MQQHFKSVIFSRFEQAHLYVILQIMLNIMNIMEDRKDVPPENIEIIPINQERVPSDHYHIYKQTMSQIFDNLHQSQHESKTQYYNPSKPTGQQYQLKFDTQCRLNDVVHLFINMRGRNFEIYVHISDQNSPLSKSAPIQKGIYGSIYTFQILDKEIAVKSYDFSKNGDTHYEWFQGPAMREVITEYLIYKESSRIKSGPYMHNWFGYDLIVFNNRIEFAMEKCEPIGKITKQDEQQLMKGLFQLHVRGYVHNDITPNNIMRSPTYGKTVLIDYGFSQLVAEQMGYKTLTGFQGTPEFASRQMVKLFSIDDKEDYIDLYYNDLIALQKSIRSLRQSSESDNLRESNKINLLENEIQFGDENELAKINKGYYFYLFVLLHHSICYKLQKTKQLLHYQNRVLVKLFGSRILKIISFFVPHHSYEQILFEQLGELRYMDEFANICKTIRIRRSFMINPYVNDNGRFVETMVQKEEYVSEQMKYIWNSCTIGTQFNYINEVLKCILNKSFYQFCKNKIIFYCLFFDLVRFDSNVISIQSKQKVAINFLSFLGVQPTVSDDPLFSAKKVMKCILQNLIQVQQTKHIQHFRLNVIAQAIIAEIDITEQLQALIQLFRGQNCTIHQIIAEFCCVFYYLRFMDLKFAFIHREISHNVRIKLERYLLVIEGKIKSKQMMSSDPSDIFIGKLMLELIHLKDQYSQRIHLLQKDIIQIENRFTFSRILKFYSYKIIQLFNDSNYHDKKGTLTRKIREQFSSLRQMRIYSSYLEQIYWSYTLSDSYLQRKKVMLDCISYLDHPPFYENLVVYLTGYHTRLTLEQYLQIVNKFINCCFQQNKWPCFIKELTNLIQNIQESTFIATKDIIIIKVAKMVIQRIQEEVQSLVILNKSKTNVNTFRVQSLLIQFGLPFYINLYCTQSEEKGILLTKLSEAFETLRWSILQKSADISTMSQYDCFLMHHCLLLNQTFHQSQNQLDKIRICKFQLCIMDKLPTFLTKDIITNLLRFFKVMTEKVSFPKDGIFLQKFIKKLTLYTWNYCQLNKQYYRYFQYQDVQKSIIVITTMHYLRKTNQIYLFLSSLIQFLGSNPSTQNIKIFYSNIIQFYRNYPQFFKIFRKCRQFWSKWKNRFNLILYAMALDRQSQLLIQFNLFKLISRNVFMHSWQSKQLILFIYFTKILNYSEMSMQNSRKKRLVILREMKCLHPEHGVYFGYNIKKYEKTLIKTCKLNQIKGNQFKKRLKKVIKKMIKNIVGP